MATGRGDEFQLHLVKVLCHRRRVVWLGAQRRAEKKQSGRAQQKFRIHVCA
jgi:hypothetical protein